MHVVQVTVEDFATRNNGVYPTNAATTTADGALALAALLPGGAMPNNPFTGAATSLDWSNVLLTRPATDAAGGIAINVVQTVVGGAWDAYDIVGEDDNGAQLSLVLTNQ